MGVLDFLKVAVSDRKSGPKPKAPRNVVRVDSKEFPLAVLMPHGFVATGFDDSLVKGQTAKVTISIDDSLARFSFSATVGVAEAKGGRLAAEFNILAPDTVDLIKKYNQLKKQKGVR